MEQTGKLHCDNLVYTVFSHYYSATFILTFILPLFYSPNYLSQVNYFSGCAFNVLLSNTKALGDGFTEDADH